MEVIEQAQCHLAGKNRPQRETSVSGSAATLSPTWLCSLWIMHAEPSEWHSMRGVFVWLIQVCDNSELVCPTFSRRSHQMKEAL